MTPDQAPETRELQSEYELCIMRHGAAAQPSEVGYNDAKRPLTESGKRKMQEIAEGLRQVGFTPDYIVSSPLVRALETAKIVASVGEHGARLEISETLSPGASPESLLALLAKRTNPWRALVVGHEPD